MASSESHIQQWKHNRKLLAHLPPAYPDWIVTVTFYVALQAVDALLAHDKVKRVNSHEDRNGVLMATNRYQHIWKKYSPLHSLSRTVRYLANPADWVPVADIDANVWNRYLYPIENSVQKLLGHNLSLPRLTVDAPTAKSALAQTPTPPPA